jgi:PPOX class probable F420-dependent enzyme
VSGSGKDRVLTGISGLDEMLLGGIPRGKIVLVCGGPGTGKTIFSQHYMFSAISRGERHAVLGTKSAGGAPQISSVWYLYEGGRFYVSAGVGTAKVRNLRRAPRASICVDGGYPDYRTVVAYGEAELLPMDTPQALDVRLRIIRRYHESEEEARRYEESTREPPSTLIVITPHRILGQDYN